MRLQLVTEYPGPRLNRNADVAMDARAGCPVEKLPYGAHMEIGTYGDLSTLRWAPSKPWAADLLTCRVAYGARRGPR